MLPANWQWALSRLFTGLVSNYCWLQWHLLVRQRSTRVHRGTNSQEEMAAQQTFLCLPCLLHVKDRGKHWGQSLHLRPGLALPHQYPILCFGTNEWLLVSGFLVADLGQPQVHFPALTPLPHRRHGLSFPSLRQQATLILLFLYWRPVSNFTIPCMYNI